MHLNMAAFVGRTKPEVLDNLVLAGAARAGEAIRARRISLLVLRSDGDPRSRRASANSARKAVAARHSGVRRDGPAGQALKALRAHERFVQSRGG